LTTDFGLRDGYVAAMKGVMLSIDPEIRLVDVTHEITPQDVMEGAFVLRSVVSMYPEGTVHLAVVDPGVGTGRRAIAIRLDGQIFVGPDNGLFSLLLTDGQPDLMVELDIERFWRSQNPSATFHGRDIFAPVAARLASGLSPSAAGTPVESIQSLHWPLPISDEQGIQGWVVHVDRFGNCITNISREQLDRRREGRPFRCYAGNAIIERFHASYGHVPAGDDLVLFGSDDLLEIAIHRGNASEMLGIRKGAPVNVVFSEERG